MGIHEQVLHLVALTSRGHDVSWNFHVFIGGRDQLRILGRETLQGVHSLRRLAVGGC